MLGQPLVQQDIGLPVASNRLEMQPDSRERGGDRKRHFDRAIGGQLPLEVRSAGVIGDRKPGPVRLGPAYTHKNTQNARPTRGLEGSNFGRGPIVPTLRVGTRQREGWAKPAEGGRQVVPISPEHRSGRHHKLFVLLRQRLGDFSQNTHGISSEGAFAQRRNGPQPSLRSSEEVQSRYMKSGIWNLGFGVLAVLAGAGGGYVLPGTNTPTPLIVVGAGLAAFGLFQIARASRERR